jgi:L-iditol 2-dehydrogenase
MGRKEGIVKAALLQEKGRVVITEVATPTAGPTDLLIRVAYAGICGSDLHTYNGVHPFRKPPVVLGHELAGTVAALGSEVRGFSLGERVTVMPVRSCGECLPCRQGRPNICVNKVVPGVRGWVGTFAEYFVAPAATTFKLGEHTALSVGTLAEPFAVGVHSVAQGRVASGENVLVLGGGSIGLLTAVAAKMAGAGQVAITDLYDYNLAAARALGVEATFNARQEGLVEAILRQFPEKFAVVLLTGGNETTIAQALALVQRGGRVVVTALFLEPVRFDIVEVTLYEIEVIGSQIYGHADFRVALDALERGAYPFERLLDHTFPLDQAQEALSMISERRQDAIKVLLQP